MSTWREEDYSQTKQIYKQHNLILVKKYICVCVCVFEVRGEEGRERGRENSGKKQEMLTIATCEW